MLLFIDKSYSTKDDFFDKQGDLFSVMRHEKDFEFNMDTFILEITLRSLKVQTVFCFLFV